MFWSVDSVDGFQLASSRIAHREIKARALPLPGAVPAYACSVHAGPAGEIGLQQQFYLPSHRSTKACYVIIALAVTTMLSKGLLRTVQRSWQTVSRVHDINLDDLAFQIDSPFNNGLLHLISNCKVGQTSASTCNDVTRPGCIYVPSDASAHNIVWYDPSTDTDA